MSYKINCFNLNDIVYAVPAYGWGWSYVSGIEDDIKPLDYGNINFPDFFKISISEVIFNASGISGAVGYLSHPSLSFWNQMWIAFYCNSDGEDWDIDYNLCPFVAAEISVSKPDWFPSNPPLGVEYIRGSIIPGRSPEILIEWKKRSIQSNE